MIEHSEAWQSFRNLNFESPLESDFSYNKKSFVSRTVMIQRALHSLDPVNILHAQNLCVRHTENLPRASEVKVFAKN